MRWTKTVTTPTVIRFCLLLVLIAVCIFVLDNQRLIGLSGRYTPTHLGNLTFGTQNSVVRGKHTNHYAGSYAVVIVTANPVPIGDNYDLDDLKVDVDIYVGGERLLMRNVIAYDHEFWGQSVNGIALLLYEVPRDLPEKKPLEFVIDVDKSSFHSLRKYQFQKIVVIKRSDK